jgi:hypothetical protein
MRRHIVKILIYRVTYNAKLEGTYLRGVLFYKPYPLGAPPPWIFAYEVTPFLFKW